jgi:Domain of unknown function (DUF4386)
MATVALSTPLVADAAWHDTPWPWLLARWALLQALSTAALIGGFGLLAGAAGPVPVEQLEFVGAMQVPVVFRITAALDALTWLTIAGVLIVCAGLYFRQAPTRAVFVAACGVGQVVGALGAYVNLQATGELAARYTTSEPAQQAVILQASLTLFQTISAHSNTGTLIYGIGYVLIAWLVFSIGRLPRWLGVWFGLSGARAVISQVGLVATGEAVAQPSFFALLVLGVFVDLAIARTFWCSQPCP